MFNVSYKTVNEFRYKQKRPVASHRDSTNKQFYKKV